MAVIELVTEEYKPSAPKAKKAETKAEKPAPAPAAEETEVEETAVDEAPTELAEEASPEESVVAEEQPTEDEAAAEEPEEPEAAEEPSRGRGRGRGRGRQGLISPSNERPVTARWRAVLRPRGKDPPDGRCAALRDGCRPEVVEGLPTRNPRASGNPSRGP